MTYSSLAGVNACLNATATVLLLAGYRFMRRGEIERHRNCMLAAFGVSIAFLVSYLIYHAKVGSVPFQGQGWVRPVYFMILITHVTLAAVVPVIALITLVHGLRKRFDRHRRIARWTFPIWLYVSITGVIIYVMLYHLYAA